ncbi:MAG: ABC transporter ATP-binding protein [Bdellovibrionaceae bacterium]|nr:ABC transporter ATP-binding protein [Pseudobdellovibrionaceae bacterium]
MIIDFQGVTKVFSQGSQSIAVLDQLNLQIQESQSIAIVGESGSGKSTLLSLIAGLESPSSGELRVLGKDYWQMDEDEITVFRGKNIGIVFQSYYLVPYLTALENIMLPLEINGLKNDLARGEELLRLVKLDHRGGHFFHQLSGGEAQRVSLARALIHRPSLILADEPSGNLDEETGQQVMDLLFNLVEKSNSTLVLVTHNRNLAKKCQKTLWLTHGQLKEI